MSKYEVRKTRGGANRQNMGVIGNVGMHWFVYETATDMKVRGWTREACRDGGYLRKHQAEAFIAILTKGSK